MQNNGKERQSKRSPRVVKVVNSKVKQKTQNQQENSATSSNTAKEDYLSIEEQCLPELFQALIHKDLPQLIHLLDTRPPGYVCVKDRKNRTCLHYSAFLGYSNILKSLLNRERCKEIINVKDNSGKTPLLKAVESNALNCVELLLRNKCATSCQDENGITPLHVATLAGKLSTIQVLVAYKADVDVKDKLGFTPLHLSAGLGLLKATVFLLKNGADPNLKDKKGRTPLFAACTENNVDIIELLLTSGADETIIDNRGRTAALPDEMKFFVTSKRQPQEVPPVTMLSPVIELSASETHDTSPVAIDPPNPYFSDESPDTPITAIEFRFTETVPPSPLIKEVNTNQTDEVQETSSRNASASEGKKQGKDHFVWKSLLERSYSSKAGPSNNPSQSPQQYSEKASSTNGNQRDDNNTDKTDSTHTTLYNSTGFSKEEIWDSYRKDVDAAINKISGAYSAVVKNSEEVSTRSVQNDVLPNINGFQVAQSSHVSTSTNAFQVTPSSQSLDEERYTYLCHKNRELLRKKIKHCEELEAKMTRFWNKHHEENSARNNDTSTHDDDDDDDDSGVLEENNALRNEVNGLLQKNAELNEELTKFKHQLVYNEKTNSYPIQLDRGRRSSNVGENDRSFRQDSIYSEKNSSYPTRLSRDRQTSNRGDDNSFRQDSHNTDDVIGSDGIKMDSRYHPNAIANDNCSKLFKNHSDDLYNFYITSDNEILFRNQNSCSGNLPNRDDLYVRSENKMMSRSLDDAKTIYDDNSHMDEDLCAGRGDSNNRVDRFQSDDNVIIRNDENKVYSSYHPDARIRSDKKTSGLEFYHTDNDIFPKNDTSKLDDDFEHLDTIRSDKKMLNKSVDGAFSTGNYLQHHSEVDSYFQDTINKLLRENILIKRAYKEFEESFSENLKQLEEAEQEIERLTRTTDQRQPNPSSRKLLNERNQLVQELQELEADYVDLGRKHDALKEELSVTKTQNEELKKTLKLNGDYHGDLKSPLSQFPMKDEQLSDVRHDQVANTTNGTTSSLQNTPPGKPPPPSRKTSISKAHQKNKPQRPKSPEKLNQSNEDFTAKSSTKMVKKKTRFWNSKKLKL